MTFFTHSERKDLILFDDAIEGVKWLMFSKDLKLNT